MRFNDGVPKIGVNNEPIRYHSEEDAQRTIAPAVVLLQCYEIAVAEIRKLDQNAKIPELNKKDFQQMTVAELNYWLGPAGRIVRNVEAMRDALKDQKEMQRKAGRSEIEVLREAVAGLPALCARVARLERQQGYDLPEVPAMRKSPPPPMLIATAPRGGPLTTFFGDGEADTPSGGVRRVGRPDR
jgi:hypothetical protein